MDMIGWKKYRRITLDKTRISELYEFVILKLYKRERYKIVQNIIYILDNFIKLY